ncbi:MAG: response regulator [Spirochaetota bacterium]
MDTQRIVVVEDENIVALDIKLQLEHLGYVVPAVFASGERLLEGLPELEADLVLLDIVLKGELDGVETAKLVKERFDVPVILLTALDTQETLERAKFAQPFAFIVKPFDERELRNAVVISLYRHTMEQRLQRRERLFSTTLESIRDGVLVTDEAYRIDFSNSVAESILGKEREDIVGNALSDILCLRTDDGARVSPTDERDGQLFLERDNGTSIAVERYLAPLLAKGGARSGWVVVIHDVSERFEQQKALRRQEEQLRRSQKMEAVGRLTGGIAHDFNNLLTVILGYAKLLKEGLPRGADEPEALQSDVDGIQKAAIRSAALTRQLLAFSRHQIMEPRVVDVNEIVADMEKMIQRLVSDDVRTQVDLVANPAQVLVDPSQLEQVLMNLVVNARDAMPDGGRLAIRTGVRTVGAEQMKGHDGVEPGEFVTISVRDTGVGMSEEVVERVFEPFFTTKGMGQGTGLGLSTVYGIVAQSGGFIELDSVEGRGTTFTVHLPVHAGQSSERCEPESISDASGGAETILLVEDDEAIRALLARVLRQKGYQVLEAANAGEAVLVNEQYGDTVELLITDVVMPHLSGRELADRLTGEHPGLKCLFISGYPEAYLGDDERKRLGRRFMQKPIDPARLVARVRLILDE